MIDDCLVTYLRAFLESNETGPANRARVQAATGTGVGSVSPPPSSYGDTGARGKINGLSSPSRVPPPTPRGVPRCKSNGQAPLQNLSSLIFRPLERYIIACFTRVDCLNKSFLTTSYAICNRSASESNAGRLGHSVDDDVSNEAGSPLPTLDAKTLLVGDFAENGMWWTGRSQFIPPRPNGSTPKAREGTSEQKIKSRSLRINWSELDEFYRMLLSAGSSWKATMRKLQQTKMSPAAVEPDDTIAAKTLTEIENSIAEAALHMQRTLLKACENLLRRPGRPINRPEDCRFFLVLLANPLLQASKPAVAFEQVSPDSARIENQTGQLENEISSTPAQRPLLPHERSQKTEVRVAGKHNGIVKRLFGLMANLPSECHIFLIQCFARLPEARFRKLVELVGSFVSYRLTRPHGNRRSDSPDPHGGLVPDISGPGAGTSAHLHAALGFGTNAKLPHNDSRGRSYCEDWQIRVSARVMSLLFAANFHSASRQQDVKKDSPLDASRARSGSDALARGIRCRQIVAVDAFYNSLLDHVNLVKDFEEWEARKGKFSFCQYPMFLSIWAKIRILEHDARRQMELKAREAFFDSLEGRKAVNQYLVLRVRRNCLVEDSLRGVSEVVGTGQDEIKKGLRIHFLGEEGIDSGGLRKEWFLLLVREVFDPEHGLFVYDDESHYCYFNSDCFETSDQFFLVGVVLGLAIYNSTILDVALPPFAFRKLLASAPNYPGPATNSMRSTMSYTIDDLAEYRPSLANGLRAMLEFDGNVEDTFCLNFVVVTERYGQTVSASLCPNGENRPVTNNNRREFVDLYIKYLLDSSVVRQYEPFRRGFFSVCEGNALSLFRPEEIELLVRGSEEPLDVETLKAVAIYDGWGKAIAPTDQPVVAWFWESFAKANGTFQRKLLSFITSSDRIPAMGATSLVIKLTCLGEDTGRFPIARTCFNMLGIYRYRTREILEEKLWKAVTESVGFGMK